MKNPISKAAAMLGRKGGSVRSDKKTAAARKNSELAGRRPEITWSERQGCRFTYNDIECIRDHDMQGDRGVIIRGERNGQSYERFVEFETQLNNKKKYAYTGECSAAKIRSAKCIIRRELAKLAK